jgi:hypothetical protein
MPVKALIKVVFPAPFGPRRPKIDPHGMSKLISSNALNAPKDLETSITCTILSDSGSSIGCAIYAQKKRLTEELLHSIEKAFICRLRIGFEILRIFHFL